MAIIILLILIVTGFCSAVIDIDSRTRGMPRTNTNEGNKFCFAFPHNEPQNVNDLKYLGIYIGTMEDQPVQYRIVHGDSSVNRMGTVNPGQIVREQYQTHNSLAGYPRLEISPGTTSGAKAINDFVGFLVETVDSSQKIQVAAFSDSFGSADGFCVPPLLNYTFYIPSDSTDVLDTHQYTYTAITSAGERAAMAAIVACNDMPAGTVNVRDLNQRRTSTGTSYFEQSRISRTTPYNPTKALSKHNVAVVPKTGSNEALTGLIFYANMPIGFMVGHESANVPTSNPVTINSDHSTEQIPPSYTWGYNFFVTPFMRRTAGYDLKIYPRYDNTNYTIHCTLGDGTVTYNNREVTGLQRNEVNVNERIYYNVMTQSYCCIKSDRPVVVMQYSKGHGSDNDDLQPLEDEDLGDPAMVLVAPVGQYLKKQLFSNDIEMFPNDPYRVNAASITVSSQCFHVNNITLNGSVLERDASRYTPVHCDDSGNPCGYALNKLISVGTHIIEHLTPDCYLNVIVYGFGKEKGYAFPAGFGMDPIGEIFYSIEGIVVSALEATLGPVRARVYKSGDISQPSSIDVQTFSYSGSNAATFGVDLAAATRTVNFAAGVSQVDVDFNFLDDTNAEMNEIFGVHLATSNPRINIGTPSSVDFTIIDDDFVPVMITFSTDNYIVMENTGYVIITLNASQSVPSDVLVNVMSSQLSPTVEAMVGSDYMPFSENLTIPSGQSTVTYNITITNDGVPEPTERFLLNYRVVDTGGATGIDGSGQSSVTILDTDRSVIFYDPSSVMSNEEDGFAILRIVMDRPYYKDIIISSFDVQVANTHPLANDMGVDYFNFNRTITIPAGQTSYSFNVTLNNDNILEQREEFGIRLAVLDDSRVDVAPSVATSNVIINDVDTCLSCNLVLPVAISVPISVILTAVVASIVSSLVTYYCCRLKSKGSSNSYNPTGIYDIPGPGGGGVVQLTGGGDLELKENTAYDQVTGGSGPPLIPAEYETVYNN